MFDMYDYATGEFIREMTVKEYRQYAELLADDHTGTGATDGEHFGHDGTVYGVEQ